jgi:predicted nuclease of predicted toxin-antitoxin system
MRKLKIGEEILFDYAMSESKDYHEIQCNCQTPSCRGWIRGDDWKNYDVSPYIKIKRKKYLEELAARQQQAASTTRQE